MVIAERVSQKTYELRFLRSISPLPAYPLLRLMGERIYHLKEVFLKMKRQLISLLLVLALVL